MKKHSRKETLALWGKACAICSFLALLLLAFCVGTGVAFASPSTPPDYGEQFCLPPIIPCHPHALTPTPTLDPPTATPTPTATKAPTPTPTATAVPSPSATATPTGSPTPTPTVTVTVTPSPTPGSGNQKPTILTAPNSIVMRATEIIGTDAHLSLLPDPLHPVLTFSATTISGLQISRNLGGVTITVSASGTAIATGVAIKTSILQDIVTGLSSFVNKADLLVLAAGGTVHRLVMTNVVLYIDRWLSSASLDAPGLRISFS